MGMGPLRAVCLSVLVLFGCDEAAEQGYPRAHNNPTKGEVQDTLPLSQLTILSGDNEHTFTVELADNANSRRIGLMNRRDMADDHGMLFDFGETRYVSMWMANTYLSLDMIFIDRQGMVRSIAKNTVPLSTTHIGSGAPVYSVLEVNAGIADRLGLKPGDRVQHEIFADP